MTSFRTKVKPPATLTVSATASASVVAIVNWSLPPNGPWTNDHYVLYRNGSELATITYAGATREYRDTAVSQSTTYAYSVKVVNERGVSSVSTSAVSVVTPATVVNNPGDPLFIDDFNYVVNPTDLHATKEAIIDSEGWDHLKDETGGGNGARGNFSTTTSIPGYSGTMPGLSGTGRVARWAFLPTAAQNQTDCYLTKGVPGTIGQYSVIPGNFWFQCWLYINQFGTEQSHFAARNKFLYPSDDGTATGAGGDTQWIMNFRPSNQNGVVQTYASGAANVVMHVDAVAGGGDSICISNAPEGATRLGDNLVNFPMLPNTWYLLKLHIDTSTDIGRYEKWLRQKGTMTFTKTAEWISGTTPGFTWFPHTALRTGQNMMKWWTTFGDASGTETTDYQSWIYAADFCYSDSEADLPTYGGY